MWKGILIFGVLLSLLFEVKAQSKKEFNKVWNKKMSLEEVLDHQEEFLVDLKTYFYYKHDSIDFKIAMGPQMNVYYLSMATLGLSMENQKQGKKEYVFRLIDSLYKEIKSDPEYPRLRKTVVATEALERKIVDVKNWEEDKKLLEMIGITDGQLKDVKKLVEINSDSGIGYMEMLQAYFAGVKEKNKAEEAKKREEYDQYWHFKAMIPKEKRYFSDVLGVEVKHKGHVNTEFLKKYFNTQEYPLIMIVTPELKEVARMGVTEDMKKFEQFLKQEK